MTWGFWDSGRVVSPFFWLLAIGKRPYGLSRWTWKGTKTIMGGNGEGAREEVEVHALEPFQEPCRERARR